jgi:tetratricopeptide (TPR) repeat protein
LATAFLQENKIAEGIEYFRDRLETIPREGQIFLAKLLYISGEVDEAFKAMKKAFYDESDEFAYLYLGKAFKSCSQFNEASNCFRKALELNPNSEAALLNLGSTIL